MMVMVETVFLRSVKDGQAGCGRADSDTAVALKSEVGFYFEKEEHHNSMNHLLRKSQEHDLRCRRCL